MTSMASCSMHSGASCCDIGEPGLPSSSRLYLEVDGGPAAESLPGHNANFRGESSHDHDIDPDPSPKVVKGQGLNESLETIPPATKSANATGQISRPTPNSNSKSFPQGKSKTDSGDRVASFVRRMTSSLTNRPSAIVNRGEWMPNSSKILRQLKADRSLAASARSFRY
jgi:hypothetical protein